MNGDQIRDSFIRFFENKGHQHMPSASLIPAGDPTLLFTSAGMVPFKPFFMGEQTPPSQRLTSSQKSFRTTDIDEVGDHKHLTFFEMLGNFSIGDYFKDGAVSFAWELVTQLFGLSPDRLYVTIHLDDDEAFDIWHDKIGVPVERIYRYGDKDNWWGPAGTEGPTGPCSEIHYDGGIEKGCHDGRMVEVDVLTALLREERDGAPPREVPGCHPNCDCERFVELWNLVFMQFYQDPERHRTPLPAPSVDTGMGLERAAVILQDKNNIYETDLFTPIIAKVSALTGREYGADADTDFAMRVVAEHARAASFLIGDGVVPGNEGRGYVLRRVIRRAIRYGRRLGLTGPFLCDVVEEVIPRFQAVYGELSQNRDFILRVVNLEEERFAEAFGRGNEILLDMIAVQSTGANGTPERIVSGRDTFVLYDTYGFPPELTAEIAREHGLDVDLDGFEQEMERQREQSRSGQQFEGSMEMRTVYENLGAGRTEFTGHGGTDEESVVVALLANGASSGHATQGQQAEVIISRTPFYAEGGGQLGDHGYISGPNGLFRVEDTQSPVAGLIVQKGVVEEGHIAIGDPVTCAVDAARRLDSSRNHSGTHILHAALRATLGSHVRQAGSLVSPERLRFDFSHAGRLTPDELLAVQSLSNEKVRANLLVSAQETSYADAVRQGALAFFGDRYGDVVRVVKMAEDSSEPFSFEVCGGTHVDATGQVGTLLVLGESSIGGGMRRIEAITGRAAEALFVEQSALLESLSHRLQTPVAELESRLDSYMQETDDLRRRLSGMERSLLRAEAESLLQRVADIDGVRIIAGRTSANSADAMREMGDFLRDKLSSCVVTLGGLTEGSPILVTMVTSDLVERGLNAGSIARDAAKLMGGGGGGRPEMAQAGGRQPEKLDDALAAVAGLVRAALS
jgi:alanyl-tRNA synthetase